MTSDARLALEAVTGTSHHGRAQKERGLSPAQCPFILVWTDHNLCGTVRAHSKLECCVSADFSSSRLSCLYITPFSPGVELRGAPSECRLRLLGVGPT